MTIGLLGILINVLAVTGANAIPVTVAVPWEIPVMEIIKLFFVVTFQLGGLYIAYRGLHKTMNSRLDELVKATNALARREGAEEEKARAKAEAAIVAIAKKAEGAN